jgi:hypothetical protein
MRKALTAVFAIASILFLTSGAAQAQTIQFTVHDIALKSGESSELGDVYFISSNCKSMLKGTPEVEIMDGPPGVTVAINAAKVVPRYYGCVNPVAGGKLTITAKDIQEQSYTRMVLRVNYKTLSGDRQQSRSVNVALFPPN